MAFTVKRYGWRPDPPDKRDVPFKAAAKVLQALPPMVDMRPQMPVVFDQGDLGSCTANSTCAQLWHASLKAGHPSVEPSRLFEYYNTRVLENTVREDSGASIRNAIKATVRYGFAAETDWPYKISKFTRKPPQSAYKLALKHRIKHYHSVPQIPAQLKAALAEGLPINFGFSVYESFEGEKVAKTGIMPMPGNEGIVGGHAVLMVGYDDEKQWYIIRNSWGPMWGVEGYFYMPYTFAHSRRMASDFWVINGVP